MPTTLDVQQLSHAIARLFNFVQMAFTTHAVYTSVVVDFGSLSDLLNNEW